MSYYSKEELRSLGLIDFGENVLISKKTSIYNPNKIRLGNNVRIDDYCVLSGGEDGITIGSYVHIATFCAIYGSGGVILNDFSGLSSRVIIYSATDDYSGNSLTNPTVPEAYTAVIRGKVELKKHVIIGTNSTILPDVIIGEGSAVGANSLVNKSLNSWGIYFGSPVRKIDNRNNRIIELEKELLQNNSLS
jgi:dTDP-4-amino-4,6-dideoxy-D-glucose acyltransferase